MTDNADTQPEKLSLTSMDIAEEKRELLKQCLAAAFPEVMAEDKIDFDQLKRVLGEWVEPERERFGLNWPGKAACMKVIQAPSVGTLKPCPEESVDWDTTENLFIEGDNLEALKLLQKSYFGKIKTIYIDPPYNNRNDFIYPDNYSESLNTYLTYTGQLDTEGHRFSTNTDASGRFHSRWINMMYPRLYLAKGLLKDNGVLFISIDDTELKNLRAICDEIFGEENFIATMIWESAGKHDARQIGVNHEYIIVYAKNRALLERKWAVSKVGVEPIFREVRRLQKVYGDDYTAASEAMSNWYRANKSSPAYAHRRYRFLDKNGLYKEENPTAPGGRKFDLKNPYTGHTIKLTPGRGWAFDQETFNRLAEEGRVSFITDDSIMLRLYLHETDEVTPQSVFYQPTRSASERLSKLIGADFFDFPKDEYVIQHIIEMSTFPGDIVLDFFAGSATTGHACFLENFEKDKALKFILIQLPEPCPVGSPPENAGLRSIADIGKERLKRVCCDLKDKSLQQHTNTCISDGTFGFRSFKLARSNFIAWMGDKEFSNDKDLIDDISQIANNIRSDATENDLLFELLLKDGFPLSVSLERLSIAGKTVYSLAKGALLICLELQLTQELMDALAEMEPARVICLDAGFQGNDHLKANAVQTFKARARTKETAIEFRTV